MSDKFRKTAGILLLTVSFTLITAPVFKRSRIGGQYRSTGKRYLYSGAIRNAHNGGIKVNEAGLETLQSLPGIGPIYAERIIEERQKNGPFRYPEDLEAVNGIGPQKLTGFRNMIDMTFDESGD